MTQVLINGSQGKLQGFYKHSENSENISIYLNSQDSKEKVFGNPDKTTATVRYIIEQNDNLQAWKERVNAEMNELKKENGIDLKTDKLALQRLKEAAEKAKIELSTSQETEVNLPYITADNTGPKHLVVKVTRAKLEALVENIVEKTIGPCRTAIDDAGLKVGDIDDVILVGGQTRMPMVQEKVSDFFGQEPRKDVNPDEAVAMGAAIQGAYYPVTSKTYYYLM